MRFLSLLFLFTFSVNAQDTAYARKVIKYLTSERCFGRGYIHGGLETAEKYLISEIKKKKLKPLVHETYTQSFFHSVNIFPGKCNVRINGKKLRPGIDFILKPNSCSVKGKYYLTQKDSANFIQLNGEQKLKLHLKKRLTYSVENSSSTSCVIELDTAKFNEAPKKIELNVKSKVVSNFESKNILSFIAGTSDSVIVFSAHYDHLGGMGNKTFFPGANDNASGVSMVLNLIDYYTAHQPKYKTVFIFFAGEEAGLLGSKYFVESEVLDLLKIKFLINLDLLGTGDDGIMVVNGAIHTKQFDLLNRLNSEKNLVKQIKKRGKAANSDHYWFSEAGVPCFFIYTMGGISAYHDVYDVEKTLPLTDYVDVFRLITAFVEKL